MERILVECAIRATLIAVAVAAVAAAMRVKTAAGRHTAWTIVLSAMLLLPIWTIWGPKTPLRVLPAPETRQMVTPAKVQAIAFSSAVTMVQQRDSPPFSGVKSYSSWPGVFVVIYLFGAFALFARLALGTARTRRFVRNTYLREGKRISSECASPITVGLLNPMVVLPGYWQEWTSPQLDAVLIHEGEHVRRRDPLIQWIALVNRAVFWFHPLAWWLERKLTALAEEACDAAVLARGHAPQEYSEYLLDIAHSVMRAGSRLSVVGMAMPGSFLPQRIRQIFNSSPAQPTSRRRVRLTVTVCAISSILLASGTLDHARPAVQSSAPKMQVATAKPVVVASALPAPEKSRVLPVQPPIGVTSPSPVSANSGHTSLDRLCRQGKGIGRCVDAWRTVYRYRDCDGVELLSAQRSGILCFVDGEDAGT